jgi:hypothetical protein
MAIYDNPKIVTNGLVLCLDAANRKSYPGSGTVWTDLSGLGNNGTLTNGPTFNANNAGSIVFDGTNDYVEAAQIEPSNVTLSCWFKATGAPSNNDTTGGGLITSSPERGIDYGMFYSWSNQRIVAIVESLIVFTATADNSVLQNNIYNAVSVFDGSTLSIYINGTLSVQNARVVTITYPTSGNRNCQIGRWGDSVGDFKRYFNGNIYTASIYNRALSAAEVAQNFNATRKRFGI